MPVGWLQTTISRPLGGMRSRPRVVTFTEHLEKIRGGLETANKAFNQAVGSYESRVRPAGETLQKLGAATGAKELTELAPLDATLRLTSS